MEIPGSTNKLREALLGEDILGVVIRGHLYIEAALNTIIAALLPSPSEINIDHLRWGTKLELVHALGLSPDLKPPLIAVNRIRNSFAHNPDAELNKDDINGLYGSLTDGDREMLLQAYSSTEKQVERPLEVAFRELSEQQQFLFIVVLLHTLLVVVVDEAKARDKRT